MWVWMDIGAEATQMCVACEPQSIAEWPGLSGKAMAERVRTGARNTNRTNAAIGPAE